MSNDPSLLVVVAGPNGSGKSTLTASGAFDDMKVIDPDAIARQINSDDPTTAQASAGREAIKLQNEYFKEGTSFVIETTLAGRRALGAMEQAVERGHEIELHYVNLGSVDLNKNRVAERVEAGGHDIPDADIERRYYRSLENLPTAIALSDAAILYDNSGARLEKVAELSLEHYDFSNNAPQWAFDAAYDAARSIVENAEFAEEAEAGMMCQAETALAADAITQAEYEVISRSIADHSIEGELDLDLF